jgi:cellulose synthase/poly-beta-1,6-N-acetylglucosamine synthase-like glycosyltransferase
VLGFIALTSFGSLLAVWVIYPLVMAALAARRRPLPVPTNYAAPIVSVVIATRDDAHATRSRIADCARYEYDPAKLEVVVAVDRQCGRVLARDLSVAGDPELLLPQCTVVLGDEPGGKAATLNAAVRACRGSIVVFTDTHQRFEPDAIRHLVGSLQDPHVGASSGSLEVPHASGTSRLLEHYWLFERWLRRCEAKTYSSVGVTGAIWAMRRSLWAPLPAHLILDDLYTPMRLVLNGSRVGFDEGARAIETRRLGMRQEYRRKVRTLTGVIQLCAWLPEVLSPNRNPVWLQFIFHKLLRLLTPYWLLAIVVWAAVGAGGWLLANPRAAFALATASAVASLYGRGRSVIRKAWGSVKSGLVLQAAVVVATVNGIRRRWDVWHS